MKKFLFLIALTTMIFNVSCKLFPNTENTAPKASFTISPTHGTVDTDFEFDASSSTDTEDALSVLEVRWDWENDGVWDTDYRTIKTITHYFLQPGIYEIILEVKDSDGLSDIVIKTIDVQPRSAFVTFSDNSFEALIRVTINKPIGDITDFDMATITILNGNGWNIADISGIEYCTNITNLKLSNNQIIDISALINLKSLKFLGLYGNQIEDISSLNNLTNLILLYIGDNQIIYISSLNTLTNLSELSLADNQIEDIQPLILNSGIANGDIVDLTNNPLNSISIGTYIPQLKNRGVTVYY